MFIAFYSLSALFVIQLVSTPNCDIIDYSVGLPGSQHDAIPLSQHDGIAGGEEGVSLELKSKARGVTKLC